MPSLESGKFQSLDVAKVPPGFPFLWVSQLTFLSGELVEGWRLCDAEAISAGRAGVGWRGRAVLCASDVVHKLQPRQGCYGRGNFWKMLKLKSKRTVPKNRVPRSS